MPPSPVAAGRGRPKRPLTAFNLFWRFKRAKILELLTGEAGGGSASWKKFAVQQLVKDPPGLEGCDDLANLDASDEIKQIRRMRIRSTLTADLCPHDASYRSHHATTLGLGMTFVEMNKIMCQGWHATDPYAKAVFEELAKEGRKIYHERLTEYYKEHPDASKPRRSISKGEKDGNANESTRKDKSKHIINNHAIKPILDSQSPSKEAKLAPSLTPMPITPDRASRPSLDDVDLDQLFCEEDTGSLFGPYARLISHGSEATLSIPEDASSVQPLIRPQKLVEKPSLSYTSESFDEFMGGMIGEAEGGSVPVFSANKRFKTVSTSPMDVDSTSPKAVGMLPPEPQLTQRGQFTRVVSGDSIAQASTLGLSAPLTPITFSIPPSRQGKDLMRMVANLDCSVGHGLLKSRCSVPEVQAEPSPNKVTQPILLAYPTRDPSRYSHSPRLVSTDMGTESAAATPAKMFPPPLPPLERESEMPSFSSLIAEIEGGNIDLSKVTVEALSPPPAPIEVANLEHDFGLPCPFINKPSPSPLEDLAEMGSPKNPWNCPNQDPASPFAALDDSLNSAMSGSKAYLAEICIKDTSGTTPLSHSFGTKTSKTVDDTPPPTRFTETLSAKDFVELLNALEG